MKKVISLALAGVMALSLFSGCGKTEKQTAASPSSAASESSTAATSSAAETKEPITFTMYNVEVDPYPDTGFKSPVAQEITKKTGVTLEIENAISSDAGKQKLSLMAASGDYPDFVYAKGDLNILKNVNGVVKLDEYIDKLPNIKKFYGDDLKRLRWSKEDPGIYGIGGKELGQENMEPNSGFQLQLGAVKELGYPKLKTLTDFENAIKAYKDKHPEINGQKSIGLSLLGDDWRTMITITNPANAALGNSDDGEWFVNPETLDAIKHVTRPEEKEYFRWLNHMNDIGLLDPESFVQKYDQYKAKIATGRVIALADARWEIEEPVRALKQDGKYDNTYGFFPITINEDTKFADFQSAGYLGGYYLSITSKCKDVQRAMEFFDWMSTEEAQILINWGIEGTHYTIENGKRVMKPEIFKLRQDDPAWQQKTGINKYKYPFPAYGNAIKDSTGQNFEAFQTLDAIIAAQSDIENDVLSHYGVKAFKELYPQASDFPVKNYGAAWLVNIEDPEWKAADDKILKTGYKMIPAAILAKPADFDKKWDEYMKALKDAGLEKVEQQFSQALKDRTELWK